MMPLLANADPDPFQRYFTFKNELRIPIYPVIEGPAYANDANCQNFGTGIQRRIIVNGATMDAGILPGASVTVRIPKELPCWYNAARMYIFTTKLIGDKSLEGLMPPAMNAQKTKHDNYPWTKPLCPNQQGVDVCWTGYSVDTYGEDAPNQLIEYTIISQNPANGDAFPNPNDPSGIPFLDFDVSYVNHAYLPVAMEIDDGGLTNYMGSILTNTSTNITPTFDVMVQRFLENPKVTWANFAAYTATNWSHNLFNGLVERSNRIPSGYVMFDGTYTGATSGLYTPSWDGVSPRACPQALSCNLINPPLAGNCCPNDNGEFLGCCNVRAYSIDKVTQTNNALTGLQYGGPAATAMLNQWALWLPPKNPCQNLSSITDWPSTQPQFNKQGFCDDFRTTVNYVWNHFATTNTTCSTLSGIQAQMCVLEQILGFNSKDAGQLNGSVQALMRGVPWNDPNGSSPQYQGDKFLHFWAPYDSPFNLNQFARFVHNTKDGISAPGAYSFSIDDLYGNFGGRGSTILIDVGGSAILGNKDPYDPFKQYRVSWGGGWDHATVCGRPVTIPGTTGNKLGSSSLVSFWSNKVKQKNCIVTLYSTPDGLSYVSFKLAEVVASVVDPYTGLTKQVSKLSQPDPNYCKQNSTADLFAQGKCNANLSANDTGDTAFISLPPAQRPVVTLNVPAIP